MQKRTVTYKEPADYFSPAMRKAAEEWEKEHAKEKTSSVSKTPKKKTTTTGKSTGKKK